MNDGRVHTRTVDLLLHLELAALQCSHGKGINARMCHHFLQLTFECCMATAQFGQT